MSTAGALALGAGLAWLAVWVRGHPGGPIDPGADIGGLADRLAERVRRRLPGRPAPPVGELLRALAAELAAGQPTALALQAAAEGLRPCPVPHTLAAVRSGADVSGALRRDAQAPGAGALGWLAACWEVAESSGAGMAAAVARLAESVRASRRAQAQLDAELAAVRSSAWILAALPLMGLALGQWIGADPLAWLIGAATGRVVLLVGLLLQGVGLAWLHRMVTSLREDL